MAKQIACGHCGGSHPSVAEVRACAATSPPLTVGEQPQEFSAEHWSNPAPARARQAAQATPAPRAKPAAPPIVIERTAEQLAGPARLGRSLLLSPGDEPPAPWTDVTVVKADVDCDSETVDRLHLAWRSRERLVIEWSGPLPDRDPVLNVDFPALTPASELPGERLRFAVTANSVNLLGPKPDFEPIRQAAAAGAKVGAETAAGDIVLPDGTEAWADGGPMDLFTSNEVDGTPVVPRPHLVATIAQAETPDPPRPQAELASDQLEAVGHRGGPARIIAPAGSGKTRVLTERTRHLVADRGLHPASVCLVAYNRRARQEMAERLGDVGGLDIRTLNSLALAIATGSGPFTTSRGRRSLSTISEIDARRLLDRVVPGRRRRQLTDPLEPWIDALSACRLGLRDPEEIESTYGADVAGFPEVLDAYRSELRRRGELDFDEQILSAVEILLTNPEARTVARAATPILLVDEFQDLTPAHLLLLRLLAGPAAEVFAVGDDDQTIYGYSGASPDWLVDFSHFFPGAESHPLTINYRCPPRVVEAAANLLSYNRTRVAKTINARPRSDASTSNTSSDTPGSDVEPLLINSESEPHQRLVDQVGSLLASGAAPGEIAVLARVHAVLLSATVYLAHAGHPVAKPVGVDSHVLDRSGIGAALSWLRLATAPEQQLRADDLRLALRRPPRSLHPKITDWVCEQRSVKELMALAGRLTKEREANLVTEFSADIQRLREEADSGSSTVELLDFVYHDIGLLGAASQLDQSQRTARRAAHADDLSALQALAAIGPEPDGFEAWIRNHLDTIPRFDDPDRGDTITLATIHTTKGLEWPHVIVHDVRGDLHPHRLATDIEEERRIFHVAITRCRSSVLVNAVPKGSGPTSPFVAELASPRPTDLAWPEAVVVSSGRGDQAAPTSRGGAAKKPTRSEPSNPAEAALRASLTEWRTTRCKADGVPAYIVVDNATLDAIAGARPTSLADLGRIKGIGPAKLERYGAEILGIVADTP